MKIVFTSSHKTYSKKTQKTTYSKKTQKTILTHKT